MKIALCAVALALAGCDGPPKAHGIAAATATASAADSPAAPAFDMSVQTTRAIAFFFDNKLDLCTDRRYIRVGPPPADRNESFAALERFADENSKAGPGDVLLHKNCADSFPQRAELATCTLSTRTDDTPAGVFVRRDSVQHYYLPPLSDAVMKKCLEIGGTWQERAL